MLVGVACFYVPSFSMSFPGSLTMTQQILPPSASSTMTEQAVQDGLMLSPEQLCARCSCSDDARSSADSLAHYSISCGEPRGLTSLTEEMQKDLANAW